MASDVDMLVEMGFAREKAERALVVTNNKGVEPAMEWLLAHSSDDQATAPSDEPNSAPSNVPSNDQSGSRPAAEEEQAKSIKCQECGKLFTSQTEVEYHAVKSGHGDFAESTDEKKPLSEEERREQMSKLEEKMKQKRKEREEKEQLETHEKERLRIKSGRDMQEVKQRMQEREMQKIVEQRRRDKIEDQQAKDRVRQQIMADKEARRLASQGGGQVEEPTQKSESAPTASSTVTSPSKPPPTSARLQLRLPDGRAVTQAFGAREQLSAVRLFLKLNEMKEIPFNLMTTFPKRVFTDDDYDKPLDVLGLAPSAVVIVAKCQSQM